jgi:hypothetical protein
MRPAQITSLEASLLGICRSGTELLPISCVSVWLYDLACSSLGLEVAYPTDAWTRPVNILLSELPPKLRSEEVTPPLAIPDLTTDSTLGRLGEVLKASGARSAVIVHLTSRGKICGFFCAHDLIHDETFAERDLQLCQIVPIDNPI